MIFLLVLTLLTQYHKSLLDKVTHLSTTPVQARLTLEFFLSVTEKVNALW